VIGRDHSLILTGSMPPAYAGPAEVALLFPTTLANERPSGVLQGGKKPNRSLAADRRQGQPGPNQLRRAVHLVKHEPVVSGTIAYRPTRREPTRPSWAPTPDTGVAVGGCRRPKITSTSPEKEADRAGHPRGPRAPYHSRPARARYVITRSSSTIRGQVLSATVPFANRQSAPGVRIEGQVS